eukprot:scaffold59085_cov21-Tisochrysis_lutea.AAC.3
MTHYQRRSVLTACLCPVTRIQCSITSTTYQGLREDPVKGVFVQGVKEVQVKSLEECLQYLAAGSQNRSGSCQKGLRQVPGAGVK